MSSFKGTAALHNRLLLCHRPCAAHRALARRAAGQPRAGNRRRHRPAGANGFEDGRRPRGRTRSCEASAPRSWLRGHESFQPGADRRPGADPHRYRAGGQRPAQQPHGLPSEYPTAAIVSRAATVVPASATSATDKEKQEYRQLTLRVTIPPRFSMLRAFRESFCASPTYISMLSE